MSFRAHGGLRAWILAYGYGFTKLISAQILPVAIFRLDGSSMGRVSVKEVFSRMQSRSATPSAVVLCVKDPPAVISSCRVDSLLSPNQNC
jgi:hypothetical protein